MFQFHFEFDVFQIESPLNQNQSVCYARGINEQQKGNFFIIFQMDSDSVIVQEFNLKINQVFQLLYYNDNIYQKVRSRLMNIDTTLVTNKQNILVDLAIQNIFINQNSQIIIPYYLEYQLKNSKFGRQYIDLFLSNLFKNVSENIVQKSLYETYFNKIEVIQSIRTDQYDFKSAITYFDNLLSISSTLNRQIYVSYLNQNGQLNKSGVRNNDFADLSNRKKHIRLKAQMNELELQQILNFINFKLGCLELLDQYNFIGEWIEIQKYQTHETQNKLRLTPTSFYYIYKDQMNYQQLDQNNFSNAATQHGKDYEKMGIAEYKKKYPQYIIKTYQDSLLVSRELPWLGGIPDGIVFDTQDSPIGMIEVKCPYNQRNEGIKKVPYILHNQQIKTLDNNHKYYYQIQGYLLITQLRWCDLVVHTFIDTLIIRINRNEEIIKNMKEKLTNYYMEFVLPEKLQPPRNKFNYIQIEQILNRYYN